MALFVLRKLILQMLMPSHLVGLDLWFLVGPFVYFHTSCLRTAKALARLHECSDKCSSSFIKLNRWEYKKNHSDLIESMQVLLIVHYLCTKQKKNILWKLKWASSWDYGTYHLGDQWRLRRAYASAQSCQSFRCSHTWSMEIDDGSDQKTAI